ncbi:MAG: hypothetical protein M0R03_11065 [Novosphingobium sp.]|nr:hypothetical protein [Novosphingobium sp.]
MSKLWRKIYQYLDGEFSLLKFVLWNGFGFSLLHVELWEGIIVEICYIEGDNWTGSLLGFWNTNDVIGFDFLYLRTLLLKLRGKK